MEIERGVKVTIGTISGNYLAEDNLIQANQIPSDKTIKLF
jgi:hypothetical protein